MESSALSDRKIHNYEKKTAKTRKEDAGNSVKIPAGSGVASVGPGRAELT